MTVQDEVDRPPPVAVLPPPPPIREELPTNWKVVDTPGGVLFALSEEEHQGLLIWFSDATRYIDELNSQLTYYRQGLLEEHDVE